MEKDARCVNVKSKDGKIIMSLYLYPAKGFVVEDKADAVPAGKQGAKGTKEPSGSQGDGSLMTYPQKRLLFRLLADKGIEGDAAHEHLKELFQVNSLKEVSKIEASKAIESLLEEAKGGDANGTPF